MTGCGSSDKSAENTTKNTAESATGHSEAETTTANEATTDASSETATDETVETTTQAPTETEKKTESQTQKVTEKQTEKKTEAQTQPSTQDTQSNEEIKLVQGIVNEIIEPSMTDVQKALAMNDWLAYNIKYDWENFKADTILGTSRTVKGTITTGKAVCEGYAKTFSALAKCTGLEVKYALYKG